MDHDIDDGAQLLPFPSRAAPPGLEREEGIQPGLSTEDLAMSDFLTRNVRGKTIRTVEVVVTDRGKALTILTECGEGVIVTMGERSRVGLCSRLDGLRDQESPQG